MNRALSFVLLIAFAFSGSACSYKYTFKTGAPPAIDEKRTEWKSIGLWGVIGPSPYDLEEACPEGVAEFGSYVSFLNWACAFTTIGLYSPRTVYSIPCRNTGGG